MKGVVFGFGAWLLLGVVVFPRGEPGICVRCGLGLLASLADADDVNDQFCHSEFCLFTFDPAKLNILWKEQKQ